MAKPVAVITGASSGIGLVFARKLAAGYDLVLVARRKERLEEAASALAVEFGTQVEVLVADLATDDGMSAVAERLASEPNLGLLVNNAGFGVTGRFWEASLADQEQMHRLHVMATLKLTHAALGNLVARGAGGVINVASVAGFVIGARAVSYAATKTWMVAFTEGLWHDLRSAGSAVKVQALCPGYTYSEFHDVLGMDRTKIADGKMWMTAEEVVDASLAGLREGKLIVVPGWRYKAIVAILPRLPFALRAAMLKAAVKRE
jgi:short-subunit dehydrogenase